MEKIKHFGNIQYLYGENSYIQIPNGIFEDLSCSIGTNIQQISFAYSYLILNAFLYKYTNYVDIDNETYIQNADIKQILGYSRDTKTINNIIKKGGLLDNIGLTKTIKDYPVSFYKGDEKINEIPMIEFKTINDLEKNSTNYNTIKKIVKNRNYEIKEPIFLFSYKGENGTLYEYSNTHRISIKELMVFLNNKNLNNIDFLLYSYFKSKCNGYKNKVKSISLTMIISDLHISKDSFYSHLEILKSNKFIDVCHKGWVMGESELESNEYYFKGV